MSCWGNFSYYVALRNDWGTWISPLNVYLLKNGEKAATLIILFLVHLSRSFLPSGLHCPNLWPSSLLACVLHTDFSLSGDCHCLSLAVYISLLCCRPTIAGRLFVLSLSRLLLERTGFSRPFLDFDWLFHLWTQLSPSFFLRGLWFSVFVVTSC